MIDIRDRVTVQGVVLHGRNMTLPVLLGARIALQLIDG